MRPGVRGERGGGEEAITRERLKVITVDRGRERRGTTSGEGKEEDGNGVGMRGNT